jgi:hypothetical protein
MISSEKCPVCGKRGKRPCPATGGVICPACCGSNRGSKLNCPFECGFYPFSLAGHELFAEVERSWATKTQDYLEERIGEAELSKTFDTFMSDSIRSVPERLMGVYYPTLFHSLLVRRDQDGKTSVDQWEAGGWSGLNNNDRLMMQFCRKSFVTIVEVQRKLENGMMECRDLFEPEPNLLMVYQRKGARPIPRFTKILCWLTSLADYTRISAGGFEVPEMIWRSVLKFIENSIADQAQQRPGLTSKQFLAENLSSMAGLIEFLMSEARKQIMESMDFHQCSACYKLIGSVEEAKAVLDSKPDFAHEAIVDQETGEAVKFSYTWLREGESKEIAKGLPGKTLPDNNQSVGVLGHIELYENRMVVGTLSKQKHSFARKMVDMYLGQLVEFERETIVDLARQIAERDQVWPDDEEQLREPAEDQAGVLPEEQRQLINENHLQHYTKLLDFPVESLGNKSPREAAREPALRTGLIEWSKGHIHHIELINQRDGLDLRLDWFLDELGLPELK